MRDLREKLSGTMTVQPKNSDPLKSKVENARPSMKSVATDTETEVTRKASGQATRKKSQQAIRFTFLQLCYSIMLNKLPWEKTVLLFLSLLSFGSGWWIG